MCYCIACCNNFIKFDRFFDQVQCYLLSGLDVTFFPPRSSSSYKHGNGRGGGIGMKVCFIYNSIRPIYLLENDESARKSITTNI